MPKRTQTPPPTLLWFRQDLRLADNPALRAAIDRGATVVPVYIHAPDEEGDWAPGAASRWWLHQSLTALAAALKKRGSPLVLRTGPATETLLKLIDETGADTVLWNRRYEPAAIARDTATKEALAQRGVTAKSHNGALLYEPWTVQNKSGKPFKVFTPYYNHVLARGEPPEPIPAPKRIPGPKTAPASVPLASLQLEPTIDWADGIRAAWTPGEKGATGALHDFLDESVANYPEGRDLPGIRGTSRLAPHLHFGEISPRQVWDIAREYSATSETQGVNRGEEAWLRQIVWREFAHHLLYHMPHTPTEPLRPEYANFPWRNDAKGLRAWQRGQTGFPIVDAGMRELWATGWMHNRVRMIVASFLIKDLLIPWQEGARWFWDTLVDADLGNNTMGWQWTAGCGADASPFFRVFNPTTQGEKFDANGDYVRTWVPELAALPDKYIHKPHDAPKEILAKANIKLGQDYPKPMVDHKQARLRALKALETMKLTPSG